MSNISIVVRNTPRLLLSSQGRVDTLDRYIELIICVFKAISTNKPPTGCAGLGLKSAKPRLG